MTVHLHLREGSRFAGLKDRFAEDPESTVVLTDAPDPVPAACCLLLDRAPSAANEVGFYLEHPAARLVEIVAGPTTRREIVAQAWRVAREFGLQAIRLAAGQPSLLARIRELETGTDDPDRRAAELALALGQALDAGILGARDVETLVGSADPPIDSPFDRLNALDPGPRQELLEEARERHGLKYLPAGLRRDLRSGTGLAERQVALKFEGSTAHIRLVRPQVHNALDGQMLAQLDEAWQEAEAHDSTRAIVLEAAGPAFMAGVDLDRILAWIESDELEHIVEFVRNTQVFLRRVDLSPAHTLVRLHGMAVGAGAEFCAAFDTIVATPRASLGFPETSIGIYPAMGGTQRLPRRISYPIARWWVLRGALLAATRARKLGMVEFLVDERELDRTVAEVAGKPAIRVRAARIERAAADASLDAGTIWHREFTPRGSSATAIRVTEDLLQLSLTTELETGLAAELDQLDVVYRTAEALAGIRRGAARSLVARTPAHGLANSSFHDEVW